MSFFFKLADFKHMCLTIYFSLLEGGEVARQILNFFKVTYWNTAYYHVVAHGVNALVACVPESHVCFFKTNRGIVA